MAILITYDISGMHSEVKREMKLRGFEDHWMHEGIVVTLPNTTLWKEHVDAKVAVHEFNQVIMAINLGMAEEKQIRVERALAIGIDFDNWWAIPGEAYQQ